MPFALDSSPELSEISEAVNYLLANFGANLAADPNTGQISGPSGIVVAYLYKYLAIKYADSFDGSSGFSDSPTNKEYYGVNNSNSSVESTNPADYIWYKVAGGGFGTTKFLFYQVAGGRQIYFVIDTAAPDSTYVQAGTAAIDLDIVTTVTIYQNALPTIYQWTSSSTPPTRPSTTTTYYWNTGVYTAPSGWYTEIPSNTTAGDYLWAIAIPITEPANVETTVLDWTNTSYPIYAFSKNGSTGTPGATGGNGLSALTAYLVQSQSASTPTFTTPTSGGNAPSGWSLTAPSVSVGQVLWYIQGKYNSSSSTIDGVAANTTAWTGPVAASIFQDIRSDNWNGSNPPSAGSVSTWGTQGYYISQSSGSAFLNDIYGRGVAYFRGATTDAASTISAATFNDTYYSNNGLTAYSNTNSSLTAAIQAYNASTSAGGNGIRAITTATSSNAVSGQANNGTSYGVRGDANYIGVYGQGAVGVAGTAVYASGNYGGYFTNTYPSGVAVWIDSGTFKFGSYTIAQPPGGTSSFLRADGSWAVPSGGGTSGAVYFGTNSGTATESGNTININGSTSTGIAGAYVGTSGSGATVTLDVRTTSPSDIKLKEEIQDSDVGLAFVKQLRPVSYKLKADPKHQKGYGFIAQEVEQLVGNQTSLVSFEPDWQVGDEVGFNTIHYPSYIAVLTKAIQELSTKVEELESKLKG